MASTAVPSTHEPFHVEAVDVGDDHDSGYDEASASASLTTSVTSSVYKYKVEHGRTYHAYKQGQYYFPNDATELDRLDLSHHMFTAIHHDKLFMSPLKDGVKDILDVGTGTGIWAIEMADMFPHANIIGFDLSPTQPSWVPPNVQFELADAKDEWIFGREFDFVYARNLHYAVPEKALFKQALDVLKPGGWFEVTETPLPIYCDDGTFEGTAIEQWSVDMLQIGRVVGMDFTNASEYDAWVKEAGFVNVQKHVFFLPLSGWPKDPHLAKLGSWEQVVFGEGLEGFSLKLWTQILGHTDEQVRQMISRVKKDLHDKRIHGYFKVHTICGQKPE